MRRVIAVLILSTGVLVPDTSFADHEGERCYGQECRGDQDYDNGRDDNRRAGISPGPFDRSPVDIHDNNLTICFPFSQCREKGETDGDRGSNPGDGTPIGTQTKGIACLIPFPYHCDPKPQLDRP